MELCSYATRRAVEQLTFELDPALVEHFIEVDHAVWTRTLARYDAALEKEVWVDDGQKGRVTTIIYWTSLEHWKSVPGEVLAKAQAEFDAEFGAPYRLIGEGHKECQMYRAYYSGGNK